jgi:hypothetical protein
MSSHLCSFVPPHVPANIARAHAREGLEPTDAQRSAIVSEQLRRDRRNLAPDGVIRQAVIAVPALRPVLAELMKRGMPAP